MPQLERADLRNAASAIALVGINQEAMIPTDVGLFNSTVMVAAEWDGYDDMPAAAAVRLLASLRVYAELARERELIPMPTWAELLEQAEEFSLNDAPAPERPEPTVAEILEESEERITEMRRRAADDEAVGE